MEKLQYSVADFVADESFQRYVWASNGEQVRGGAEALIFWRAWLAQHPHKQADAQEAALFIGQLQRASAQAPAFDADAAWQNVQGRIAPTGKVRSLNVWSNALRWAAAVLLLLVASGALYYAYFLTPLSVATAVGQTRRLTLPDGSTVVLSGNSSLRYARQWQSDELREVWLDGKAYFDVSHTDKAAHRFVVHAGKARIEVLGTSFDVLNRGEGVKVVLQRGKVAMQAERPEAKDIAATVLLPGEEAELAANSTAIQKKVVNVGREMAWVQQKFVFDSTPFKEVAKTIEENCGVKVSIRKQDLRNRRITASLDTKNIDVFLAGVAKLFDARVERKGETVIFY